MKRTISFDTNSASSYDVMDALHPLKRLPGVNSVEYWVAIAGNPQYMVVIDVDDDKDEALMERFDGMRQGYDGYYTNYVTRAFRKAG